MTERSDWDEAVDEAIEVLIDESTDGFALVATQGEEAHFVEAADLEEELLAVWMLVRQVMEVARAEGQELKPAEVVAGAFHVAEERGYLEPSSRIEDFDL